MKRVLGWLLLLAIVAVPLATGVALSREVRHLRDLDAAIRAEETKIDSFKTELSKLQERITQTREEVKELPESARMGHATSAALSIAKQQQLLDGLITRSRNKMRSLEADKRPIRRKMRRLGIAGSLVWLGVLAGRWTLGRPGRR